MDELEDEISESDDEDVNRDDYDLRMFGISRALPVPEGLPDLSSGPPDTAEAYLQWVRYEAMNCPQVMRVDITAEKLTRNEESKSNDNVHGHSQSSSLPDCPAWAAPSVTWVREFLLDFKLFRQQLLRLAEEHQQELSHVNVPASRDMQHWGLICFGPSGDRPDDSNAASRQQETSTSTCRLSDNLNDEGGSGGGEVVNASFAEGFLSSEHGGALAQPCPNISERISGPLLKTVLAMDQVRVVSLLTWLIQEFQELQYISYTRSQWLFSLAAVLEKPIHCDTGAAFRALLRKCCALRVKAANKSDPQLPILNTLIAVAGGYFGQDEVLSKVVASEDLM
ncbi:hypothetical protein CEUSTIGMA_g3155.t1 [Chlamydomonas eustigma]|uniref:Gem-associated protein 2 n=1 Tax=Chlamydomonas eustigma TaxID=1157962 RepID=A0A250WYM7_9CHLO|nr:hypothetical protein CEUSTIGMA_g3155.t1 [Chlamydomonas eustigma]|eukprot:GAX75712.1 hypothetical protein CEUSTIGMA_g3155.t1 [Chlamydomonas eustigma]